ncbi:eisosome protein [Senna tora]|uniref:Eisosome protein n=1 Tax=Senna tora TaxID=362788 RepID=A0A834WEY5_9FABA|nr:eisosome protein [Senna tora]
MGCFLACFGSSKDAKRSTKQRRKVLPRQRDQRSTSSKPQQTCVTLVQDYSIPPVLSPTSEIQDHKPEDQPSVSTRKKVTFDSNVKTYEPVLPDEVTDFPQEKKSEGVEKKEEMSVKKPSLSKSSSDASSVTSTGSYPPNSRARACAAQMVAEKEVESPIPIGTKNPNARDRSVYVHPVLNPVENLSQWKAVKSKRPPPPPQRPLVPQKENCVSEPSFKERSLSSKPKQEIAVDASLSNWLGSSIATPERSPSQGSNSVISHEDRPILGALTVEEIKQFSASNSPRKSPSRSPDEMPIIGTVGTYWSHSGSVQNSGSVSSFKGIPNTTSKYREDKRVNWHSTPFETRLERALNGDAAEAASTHVPSVF